jgi:hypothetical protein
MIPIAQQITFQRNRLRKNKRERSIMQSLKVVEKHFSEGQTNDNMIIVLPPAVFKEFLQFQNSKS